MLARFLGIGVALMATTGLAQQDPKDWISDPKTGCKVYEPSPEAGLSFSWSGPCVNGVAQGKGTLQWFVNGKPDGNYIGEMARGMLNGQGVRNFPSGDRFEGQYRDNVRTGRGIYTWRTGDRYEGGFLDDKRHGQGVFQWSDGTRFEGNWAGGLPNGQGTKYSPSGRTFTGNWTNGCFRQGEVWSSAAVTPEQCGFR
jgi:hypothetical protein